MFSFDSDRLCRPPFVVALSTIGAAFWVTGRNTLRLSLLPIAPRQSSSRIFLGEVSILLKLPFFVGERVGEVFWTCSACSRCSHLAKAASFPFTGDVDVPSQTPSLSRSPTHSPAHSHESRTVAKRKDRRNLSSLCRRSWHCCSEYPYDWAMRNDRCRCCWSASRWCVAVANSWLGCGRAPVCCAAATG
jgi:hypothetical protein